MYSTCLFCNKPLGANDVIEHFPVGRRLAFDAAKGRLWVVCRSCERWNLTPLEERWEAVETCERLYRDTRVRVATEQIGLARLSEGLELVRIGAPLRPEFAAWRYGDQFARRRRRHIVLIGAGVASASIAAAAGLSLGASALVAFHVGRLAFGLVTGRRAGARLAHVPTSHGRVEVRYADVRRTSLRAEPDGSLRLTMSGTQGRVFLRGEEATRALARLLPAVNGVGASRTVVNDAVRAIELRGSADRYVASIARVATTFTRAATDPEDWMEPPSENEGLLGLSITQRLALEMALHEDQERRALEGELVDLERAWRDAEEVASISD